MLRCPSSALVLVGLLTLGLTRACGAPPSRRIAPGPVGSD